MASFGRWRARERPAPAPPRSQSPPPPGAPTRRVSASIARTNRWISPEVTGRKLIQLRQAGDEDVQPKKMADEGQSKLMVKSKLRRGESQGARPGKIQRGHQEQSHQRVVGGKIPDSGRGKTRKEISLEPVLLLPLTYQTTFA